ncbi:male sterility protein-domain-containing protein [Aspergillus carlsbadensis]|nr:male sterility protein-domain-containing protein [Aspergillus carlsbadensis]
MADKVDWYHDQTVFLTGGTGYLGACLLYKLTVQVPTHRVFVFCRKSVQHAIATLEKLMPQESDEILDTGKVHFVVGSMDHRDWGIKPADLQRLRDQVTVVIHAAAETSIVADLPQVVRTNCLASLSLLDIIRSFPLLHTLLYVSSAFVNIFVPEPVIKEEVYSLHPDIETKAGLTAHLQTIHETGTSPLSERFPNPYIFSKYLAERAILDQAETLSFTVLVIRPSLICPAIRHPYPSYGVDRVTPVYTGLQMIISSREHGIERLGRELSPDSYIDELPVDLVANVCMSHLAWGTLGIVHATADLFFRPTVLEAAAFLREQTPRELQEQIRHRHQGREGSLAAFFFENCKWYCGRGSFDCRRSAQLRESTGDLGLRIASRGPVPIFRDRVEQMSRVIAEQLKTGRKGIV